MTTQIKTSSKKDQNKNALINTLYSKYTNNDKNLSPFCVMCEGTGSGGL